MEIHIHTQNPRYTKDYPRRTCREKQEADNSKPRRGNSIERPHCGIGIAKREQRCSQKADRQHAYRHLEPGGRGSLAPCPCKHPCLVEEEVCQEQNGLNDAHERNKPCSYSHIQLDSASYGNGTAT